MDIIIPKNLKCLEYVVLLIINNYPTSSFNHMVSWPSIHYSTQEKAEKIDLNFISIFTTEKISIQTIDKYQRKTFNLTPHLALFFFFPFPFLTCCAILPISFGSKGPYLRR